MITYEQIKPYIDKGLVSEQVHPEDGDVRIFNYTQETQFSQVWDDITRQCRGLIMNVKTGEILARPFAKFHNFQEHVQNGWPIPNEKPIVTEKLDGSLGIMYNLNGKTWIATRGSFVSDQAVWATNWWRENKGDEPYGNEVTHLFEIIYPENKIVVNYDFSGLVHLASIETATGKQLLDHVMPVRRTEEHFAEDWTTLEKLDAPNSEGFVIFFPEANIRMKIKFPEYVRLHKIVTGLSEIGIWEMLRDGQDLKPLLEKVPDEFFKWIQNVSTDLVNKFSAIADEAKKIFEEVQDLPTRKEQALAINKHESKHAGIVFALLDGKSPTDKIWKMCRPHGKRVFKNDIDT